MIELIESPIRSRVRADALPEHTRYRDDGCDIHPHCLTCPLPRCRYDAPGGLRALLNARRDRQIVELRLGGVPVEDLAWRFGVSRRTVFRILESRPQNGRRIKRDGSGSARPGRRTREALYA
ncbi:MAG: helix-turn-helix domain-containing protein [Chloroflexi bacterium]|nr:helix-turn-helix domain-containing protein [Chloroflexota bacterium]